MRINDTAKYSPLDEKSAGAPRGEDLQSPDRSANGGKNSEGSKKYAKRASKQEEEDREGDEENSQMDETSSRQFPGCFLPRSQRPSLRYTLALASSFPFLVWLEKQQFFQSLFDKAL